MTRKKIPFKPGDLVLSGIILAVSALLLFTSYSNTKADRVVITCGDRQSVYSIEKDEQIELSNNGHELTVSIKDGQVSVIASTCPDKLCVADGEKSRPGSVIACLPAAVTVKIEGETDHEIDWIAP